MHNNVIPDSLTLKDGYLDEERIPGSWKKNGKKVDFSVSYDNTIIGASTLS